MAHFNIPLDLPHAGRIAERILSLLERSLEAEAAQYEQLFETAERVSAVLWRATANGENPPGPEGFRVRDEVAVLGRQLVDEIERNEVGSDRIGQNVRNLFECLELGEEGAAISLRAGEEPNSLQRPI